MTVDDAHVCTLRTSVRESSRLRLREGGGGHGAVEEPAWYRDFRGG